MNLRSQIESIVSTIDVGYDVAFRYATKYDENIKGDNQAYPAIVMLEPDQFGFRLSPQNGAIHDRTNTFFQIVDRRAEIAEMADYRESTLEAMRTLAARFIQALDDSNKFEPFTENIPGILIAETYDANVCGIEININLTEKQPRPC